MDGVRAYWNTRELVSRHGNVINCPEWFVSKLPTTLTLDGELWMGKGNTHSNIASVLNSKTGDWNQLGYYVFDIPSSLGTYEEKMEEMMQIENLLPAHIHIVEHIRCTGTDHLYEFLSAVVAEQGEGVMLRQPNFPGKMGYTSSLLKVKVIMAQKINQL